MELGQVLGPMLDYTRYYPTTLPMHQPRHDSSEASAASDEVRVAHDNTSVLTPGLICAVSGLSKESRLCIPWHCNLLSSHQRLSWPCSMRYAVGHTDMYFKKIVA